MLKEMKCLGRADRENEEDQKGNASLAWPFDFYGWPIVTINPSPIHPSNHKADIGWGYMLRSGQILLANALLIHFLSRYLYFYAETWFDVL